MIKAKKSLGQNFLIDNKILETIVNTTLIENKTILEIGPGTGNLTSFILKKKPKKVIVVEKDTVLANKLYDNFKNQQKNNKLKLKKYEKIKDYNNNLNFNLLSDKSSKIKDSDEYKENRKRWHNRLKSDIYVNESINVLLNLKTKKIENNNILAKVG